MALNKQRYARILNGVITDIGNFDLVQSLIKNAGYALPHQKGWKVGMSVGLKSYEPKTYEIITYDRTGIPKATLPKPKEGLFRRPSEGGPRTKAAKKIKFKDEYWNQSRLANFFRLEEIHADHTQWIVSFHTPCRKMTAADQLQIMLEASDTMYLIGLNRDKRVMIISNLEGEQ